PIQLNPSESVSQSTCTNIPVINKGVKILNPTVALNAKPMHIARMVSMAVTSIVFIFFSVYRSLRLSDTEWINQRNLNQTDAHPPCPLQGFWRSFSSLKIFLNNFNKGSFNSSRFNAKSIVVSIKPNFSPTSYLRPSNSKA